jgi:hypothetical protein
MTRWQKSIEEGRSCRNLSRKEDPAVESSGELTDEEHIEEIFEQLWAIPSPVKPRVAAPARVDPQRPGEGETNQARGLLPCW